MSVSISNPILLLVLTFIIVSVISLRQTQKKRKHDRKHPPPPGPLGFPIIGNLHMLGILPHRTLQSLAKKYGPIMSLRLGQFPTIVVSSSESAKEFLKTHDVTFANRPKLEASEYGSKGVALSEYGPYWRDIRKVCTLQLLSTSKVESFKPLRKRELQLALNLLMKSSMASEVVDLSQVVHNIVENFVYKMVLGRSKDDEFDLKGLIQNHTNLFGVFNIADYIPSLAAFNLQGLKQKFEKNNKALDQMLEKIIEEHRHDSNEENGQHHHKDFIDVLLSLIHRPTDPHDEHSHVINETNIKAILLDLISGSFDPSAVAIEWALSELLRHPRVMKNLQDELDNVVGRNKLVEENDLEKLSYLDNVIKETLRLYPPGPLVPRESTEDAIVQGYFIEKKSRILINMWAIGRDSKMWSDNAEVFYPERFINNSFDFRRHDFQFVPFGFGRRICPGLSLGLVMVKFVVAQLVHCFSWELSGTMTPDDLDMCEKFGLSIPRLNHLFAVPKYRLLKEACNESK